MRVPGPTASEKIIAYFAANPDDTLRAPDAAIKLGLVHHTAVSAMSRLMRRGFVSIETKGRAGLNGEYSAFGIGPVLSNIIGRVE